MCGTEGLIGEGGCFVCVGVFLCGVQQGWVGGGGGMKQRELRRTDG